MKDKTKRIIYWIVTILFSLFMLFSGIVEILGTESANKVLTDLGYPIYLNIIIGIAKILGVVAILQTKYITIKEWAYAGFTIDLVGAAASIALSGAGILAAIPIIPFLVVMFTSYSLWKKLN